MKARAFFGIDLGTTQCSVAYVMDSPRIREQKIVEPQLVRLGSERGFGGFRSDTLQSVVGLDWTDRRSKRLLFGADFFRTFQAKKRDAALLRRGQDFFTSVKSDMGTNRIYPFSKIDGVRTPVQTTTTILQRVAALTREANPDLDVADSHVVITVPASFSGLARQDTIEAARGAGFRHIQLLDEPVAALLDFVNHGDSASFISEQFENVLVFDYGGGTCDLALMRVRYDSKNAIGLRIQTLAISPYSRLGGDDVDRAIVEQVLLPNLQLEHLRGSSAWRALIDTLAPAVAKPLKERLCAQVEEYRRRHNTSWPRSAADRKMTETIALPTRFLLRDLDVKLPTTYSLTFDEFEAVMEAFVAVPADFDDPDDCPQSLLRPVMDTLKRAELHPEHLKRFVLHGGSSLNPFVVRMLQENLGQPGSHFGFGMFRTTPSPIGSVARGAALSCYWEHARDQVIVPPILSEALGVIVSDGTAEELLRAGTELPYPNEHSVHDVTGELERFFVPEMSEREIIVPYFTGYMGAERTPRHAGNIKVAVPERAVAGTPIRIRLRVDADKTLKWWFSVAGGEPVEAESVADPWTRQVPSYYGRRLVDHRRTMRQRIDTGAAEVDTETLLEEVWLMHKSGAVNEALTAATDILDVRGESANVRNIRALCFDGLARSDEALIEFESAAKLAPKNAILIGNLGCAYEEAGRIDEAVATIRRALSMNPGLGYLYEALGRIARHQRDERVATTELTRAESIYKERTDKDPFDRESWISLARVRMNLGDYEGAARAMAVARDIDREEAFEGGVDAIIRGTSARQS